MSSGQAYLDRLAGSQDTRRYQEQHWQGSFSEYLDVVKERPQVARTAYQRLYDMIMSYGTYPVEGSKDGLIRYKFFDDPEGDGRDAIFGLTKPLMDLVNVFKSAALTTGRIIGSMQNRVFCI